MSGDGKKIKCWREEEARIQRDIESRNELRKIFPNIASPPFTPGDFGRIKNLYVEETTKMDHFEIKSRQIITVDEFIRQIGNGKNIKIEFGF